MIDLISIKPTNDYRYLINTLNRTQKIIESNMNCDTIWQVDLQSDTPTIFIDLYFDFEDEDLETTMHYTASCLTSTFFEMYTPKTEEKLAEQIAHAVMAEAQEKIIYSIFHKPVDPKADI